MKEPDKALFPETANFSDAEKAQLLREIERESGIYILANIAAVWLLICLAAGRIAEYLDIEFFRGIGGWVLLLLAFVVAALVSMRTHRALMAYLIAEKLDGR